jgi:hypothetical protein
MLALKLGLDASKYKDVIIDPENMGNDDYNFAPQSMLNDTDRFKSCVPLSVPCLSCKAISNFSGVYNFNVGETMGSLGLHCPCCRVKYSDSPSYISNLVSMGIRTCIMKYYDSWLCCEDYTCGFKTRYTYVNYFICIEYKLNTKISDPSQ